MKKPNSRHSAMRAAVRLGTMHRHPKLRPRSARVADLWSLGKAMLHAVDTLIGRPKIFLSPSLFVVWLTALPLAHMLFSRFDETRVAGSLLMFGVPAIGLLGLYGYWIVALGFAYWLYWQWFDSFTISQSHATVGVAALAVCGWRGIVWALREKNRKAEELNQQFRAYFRKPRRAVVVLGTISLLAFHDDFLVQEKSFAESWHWLLVGSSAAFLYFHGKRKTEPNQSLEPTGYAPRRISNVGQRIKKRFLRVLAVLGVGALAASVIVPRALPSALSFYRSDILFAVPTKAKRVFITIDDAPSKNTTEILDVLKKHGVPATFFIISDRVSTPAQLAQIVRGQHSLGNHLQTTKACSKLSQSEFQASFDNCAALLQASTKPRFFRPASDFGTRQQIAYARARGYQAVIGTMFPMDHWISDPDWLVRLSSWLAVRGGILILHDGAVRGQTTAAVLERLIPKLKAAGFSFGRLQEIEPNESLEPPALRAAAHL